MEVTNKLTPKQLEVYLAIQEFIKKYNYSPTVRELCKICGTNSTATIHAHLNKMKNKGFINFESRRSRTISIIKEIGYDEIWKRILLTN